MVSEVLVQSVNPTAFGPLEKPGMMVRNQWWGHQPLPSWQPEAQRARRRTQFTDSTVFPQAPPSFCHLLVMTQAGHLWGHFRKCASAPRGPLRRCFNSREHSCSQCNGPFPSVSSPHPRVLHVCVPFPSPRNEYLTMEVSQPFLV